MDVAVTRSQIAQPATWLRDTTQVFILTTAVRFSNEERWAIATYNLYHHVVFDRTPPWYFPALRDAERARKRAADAGARYDWPWYVPPSVPPEWIVTVGRLIREPVFETRFRSAAELDEFEPRILAAFGRFKRFLGQYTNRPHTSQWRF